MKAGDLLRLAVNGQFAAAVIEQRLLDLVGQWITARLAGDFEAADVLEVKIRREYWKIERRRDGRKHNVEGV